jgi:hypothetical protein
VTGLLARAASAFVEPAPAVVAPVTAAPSLAARALVFGRAADTLPLAAALAGELRVREHAAAALLVTWPGEPPRPALATRSAQRLAARLDSRGMEPVARGRLAWLALSGPTVAAAAAVVRAEAAVDVPTVVAVTGPRCGALDALLEERDLVVVVLPRDADPALEELALAGFAACRAPVILFPPLEGASLRLLALAGRGRLRQAPTAEAVAALASLR